ncbi:MAG: carboxypeptidase-like regulatory domain-containing protein [Bacteroidales bacterium]|nr:carboxypeptidase-like regulatory domain-containing protein [Candidatus Colicola equi]
MVKRLCYIFIFLLLTCSLSARTTRVYGYVVDEQNVGIELANVVVEGTTNGTATNRNGYYSLQVELNDTVILSYSMIGYVTLRQQLYTDQDVFNVNVVLPQDAELLQEVEVRGIQRQTDMMDHTSAEVVRLMPDATGGSIESLLITFAGVSQNNELSTQYNVRGGSFDENSVYVNGIEVHRPLLIRSGQQEGLSFVNPYMVEQVNFSAGGYNAQFGDKMSSVLDIRYKRPTHFESNISVSLLGANVYAGWGDSTQSYMHGIRYKTSKYMLGALPTKGNYQPNFLDYQTQMTWKIPHHRDWEMAFLANVSYNDYSFRPDSMSEGWGGEQGLQKTIWYEGQEKDHFLTAFASLSAQGKVSPEVTLGFNLNGFYTNEQETYDITAEYVLTDNSSTSLGTGTSHEHARNKLSAGVINLAHTGAWTHYANTLSWGLSGQVELISDRISEWEWRDSMGYSMPNTSKSMDLYYTQKGETSMTSGRIEAYLQDAYRWNTNQGNVTLTAGARLNYWTYTNEVLVSPRASVVWQPGWKRDFTFRFATGLYYQAPFYKELRDTIIDHGVTRIRLNDHLKAQRSVHAVLGFDYYFRAWGRPFKFTTEAYAKYTDQMISYTVDNVRVRYSGKNDSKGYTLGLDLKLYGELVPGVDSWISFSCMRSRMQMLNDPYHRGWFPSPQEQRWSLSIFFQDYIPKLPQYKLHLKFVFSDGLPFGYPHSESMRYLSHLPIYKRIDIGASRTFSAVTDKFMRKPSAQHVAAWSIYFEVFNLADWKNVNSYTWVSAANGAQWASPNFLTGRMFNLRLSVDLK